MTSITADYRSQWDRANDLDPVTVYYHFKLNSAPPIYPAIYRQSERMVIFE